MSHSPIADAEFSGTDRFVVRRRIGSGGMGVVYKVHDRTLNETVALKTIKELDASTLYRFKQEFRLLADIAHPNLIRLYELVSDDNRWFFTMEFVEGVSFLKYVRTERHPVAEVSTDFFAEATPSQVPTAIPNLSGDGIALPSAANVPSPPRLHVPRLLSGLRQIVEATCALHNANILHRDIKPSNVLVTPSGRVVLLDFGLAVGLRISANDVTSENQIAGTPSYMSPEQAGGFELSPASDWYSIGVMLFEALTGQCPHVGHALQVMQSKQEHDAPRASEFTEGVPEDLDLLCSALLHRRADLRPCGAEILARLGAGRAATHFVSRVAVSDRLQAPVVGRIPEAIVLRESLAQTRVGRTTIVLIDAPSGMGKSLLVRRFLDELQSDEDAVVLTGRCYERETVPYKAMDDLVDALSRYLRRLPRPEADALMPRDVTALSRVFPVLKQIESIACAPSRLLAIPDPQELRQRAFAALRELLARLGDRRTLILHIDDLQWGDLDSASLLADLLRPPQAPVMLFLASYRTEDRDRSRVLQVLLPEIMNSSKQAVDVRTVSLAPLGAQESEELARSLLISEGVASGTLAASIARESQGNPYLIDALVRHHFAGGSPGAACVTLDDALWARVLTLSGTARRLLTVTSVAGHPLRQADALQASGVGGDLHEALGVLRTSRLIRTSGVDIGEWIEPYHDKVRESVVSHLGEPDVTDCHRRLAHAMEASEFATDPATIGGHFLGGGDGYSACRYFVTAGDAAVNALAFDRAADLYRRTLDLREHDTAQERDLKVKLADALANAGRGKEAAHEYLIAAQSSHGAEALELRRRAALQSLISGHIDQGIQALSRVLAEIGLRLPATPLRALCSMLFHRLKLRLRGLRSRIHDRSRIPPEELTRIDVCWSAACGLSIVDTIYGAGFHARALILALRAGEPGRLARALAFEAAHAATAGTKARPYVERAFALSRELAASAPSPYLEGFTAVMSGLAAFLWGEWSRCADECTRGEEILREQCTGVQWELNTAQAFGLWGLFYMGQVGALRQRLPKLIAEARDRGNLYALMNLGTFIRQMDRLAGDDPVTALVELDEIMGQWSQNGFHVQHLIGLYGRLQIDLYRGQPQVAWEECQAKWSALRRSHLLRVEQVRIFITHMRARCALAAACGGNDIARELLHSASRDAAQLEREHAPWAAPLSVAIRAGIARQLGDLPRSGQLLSLAAEAFDRLDMSLYAASARRHLGRLLCGQEGASLIQCADDWMTSQRIENPAQMAALHIPGFGFD